MHSGPRVHTLAVRSNVTRRYAVLSDVLCSPVNYNSFMGSRFLSCCRHLIEQLGGNGVGMNSRVTSAPSRVKSIRVNVRQDVT